MQVHIRSKGGPRQVHRRTTGSAGQQYWRRTMSPSARHASASPTAPPGPPPSEARDRLPHRGQQGTLPASQPRSDDLDPHHAVPRLTVTVTVAPDWLYRTLLPKSSLTSRAASSPHGCPGPSTPDTKVRATRARSARPASVTLSRTVDPAISALALPRPHHSRGKPPGRWADTPGSTLDSAAHVKPEHAASPARPWPSVESRRLRRPSWRPGRRPLYVRGHRDIAPYSATR